MPQLLPAAIAYIIPSTAATAFTIGTTAITYASIISTVVVAAGSYYAAKSMMSVPDFATLENQTAGKLQMQKATTPASRVIYGTQRVSGPIAYAGTSGDKNRELDLVILLAGHECAGGGSAGHRGIYFNDVRAVEEDGTINSPYNASNVATLIKVGADSQTPLDIQTPEWQNGVANRNLNGICLLHAHLIHDPQVFPSGIPNISVVIDGKKVYSVTGSFSEKVFSDNPADILYDYLTDEFGCTTDEIDLDSFQDAHAISNEIVSGSLGQYQQKRYTCNMTFQTSEKPQSIIENILKSCYGKLIYSNGKFSMKVGAYSYPTITLTEADLRDGLTLTTRSPIAQAYNKVTGLYVDGSSYTSSFQSAEFVPYTSSFYLAEDGGVESVQNIELLSVTNQRQARRLGAIALLDSRQDMVLSFPAKPSALTLVAGDNVYIKNDRFGWVTQSFEVTSISINPDLSCDLTLKESSPAVYAWAESEQDVDRDISPNTTLPNPFTVDAIPSLTASNVPTQDGDGTIFPGVELTWPQQGSGSISRIELDYKEDIEANWTALTRLGAGATTFTTIDVTAGTTYDFRIRQFNYFGVASPYTSASILVIGDNTIPQAPTASAVATTGSVTYTWTYPNPQEADYKHTKIVINGVSQGFVAGTTFTKVLAGGGPTTASFQDFDTSGNGSATSSLVYAYVAPLDSIASGSAGPSGSKGDTYYTIYRRSATVPSPNPPIGNLTPAFWSTTIPVDDGNALWQSTGLISGADGVTLIGSWSQAQRVSGKVSYYQAAAPVSGSDSTPVQGDLWWDTDDNYKPYRWNGTTWQAVDDGRINPISQSLVSFGGQYALTVTASGTPRIAGFRIINQSGAESDFTVQADKFRIYSTSNGTVTQSFVADANGVYMPQALIRELDCGKLTAGTINATVKLTAAKLESPEITGSGIMINSGNGMRYQDNNGNFIITGGSQNGETNGAQIDLVGVGGGTVGTRGVLALSAGDVGTNSGDGTIRFRTAATEQGIWHRDGTLEINHSSTDNGFKGQHIRFGNSSGNTDRAVSAEFGNGNALTYAGGSGVTGTLTANTAHRWVDSGNNNELMALTTAGHLYVSGDMHADNFVTPSSARFKENVKSLVGSLEIVKAIEPKTFDFINGRKNQIGFIAETMMEKVPSVVIINGDGEVAGLDYGHLTPILWGAIKEQQIIIDNLRQRITNLERR